MIESGKQGLSRNLLKKICSVFDVSADWLLGFQEEAEARGKLRRAKVSSTQLSTYFVGWLELSDILREARLREGTRFDLRAFNERLLSFGSIPPRDVRALLHPDAAR